MNLLLTTGTTVNPKNIASIMHRVGKEVFLENLLSVYKEIYHMVLFFPEDKDVPTELIFDKIKVRQLKSSDNELDYQAVIESGFRPAGFPKEENLEQISRHEKDHNDKKEFAFTIMDTNETICYGCLFVKPLSPFLKFAFFNERVIEQIGITEADPGISFWITPSGWEIGLYEKLIKELIIWFEKEWSFDNLYFLGMRPSQKEKDEIEKVKEKQVFLFEIEEQQYILWKLF